MLKSVFIFVLFIFVISSIALSHPGRTAKDGCHYCRTNCAKWGVPKDQRHCHYSSDSIDLLKTGSDQFKNLNEKVTPNPKSSL